MAQTVLIVQPIAPVGEDYLTERGYTVRRGSGATPDDIIREAADCDALLVRTARITPAILDAAPRLKVIGRHGVGVDNIDVAYARQKGVVVTNAPLSNSNAVAEHTLFLLLGCAKRARAVDRAYRGGRFDVRNEIVNIELRGKTLGVLGLGRIGQSVAKKALYGLDMRVVGYDPFVTADSLDPGITLVRELEDAARAADFLTIHLPLTNSTRHRINRAVFAVMKPESYLINAARGEIVDEDDLLAALDAGQLAGGAFDLLSQEPPPTDHPLFGCDNVLLTPHNAAHTHEAFQNMALHAAQGIHEVLSGQAPTWPVNP